MKKRLSVVLADLMFVFCCLFFMSSAIWFGFVAGYFNNTYGW